MKTDLRIRLVSAACVLAAGLSGTLIAAELGVVHLGAGDMKIELGKSRQGLKMNVVSRSCPPNCGVDIAWRPLAAR
jgi:hypothetical protein